MSTVLVVDDKPMFRESLEAVLRAHGFKTATASNGQEAILALGSERPDLVLLDLGMPVLDGLGVLRHIRSEDTLKAMPVIILSAEADRERIVEAVKLGISGYVLKTSVSYKDLLQRVKDQLSGPGARAGGPAAVGRPATTSPRETSGAAPGAPAAAPNAVAGQARAPASNGVGRTAEMMGDTGRPAACDPSSGEGASIKSLKPILTRTELLDRLKACEELKGFSPTVTQVLKLTASPNCSLDIVAKAVRQDQAMALKILKIANSSVYSRGDRVDTVHKAILRIGMESIRQVVLNISVVEQFSGPAFKDELTTPLFWEHSIGCGIIAAKIGQALDWKETDSAFTSGLLHDLGRVIFAEVLGDQYTQVMAVARRMGEPLEVVETRMLLLNHADVMDRLLSSWKFPKHLVDPIMHHHASLGNVRRIAPTRVPEILCLGLANRLAHAMLLGTSGNETIYPTEEHCRGLNISADSVRSIEETARQQTDDAKFALLANTSRRAWPSRTDQIRGELTSALRPLFISASPEFDAYRIFCNELSGSGGEEGPNLAVVHIADAKERGALAEKLARAEEEAKATSLPVLMLSPAGQHALDNSALVGRKSLVLCTPMPVSRFVDAVNSLIASGAARAAA